MNRRDVVFALGTEAGQSALASGQRSPRRLFVWGKIPVPVGWVTRVDGVLYRVASCEPELVGEWSYGLRYEEVIGE